MYVVVATIPNGDRVAFVDSDGTPFESATSAWEWARATPNGHVLRDVDVLDCQAVN